MKVIKNIRLDERLKGKFPYLAAFATRIVEGVAVNETELNLKHY